MFSNSCFSFFDKFKQGHSKDGGPRCYIEFQYENKRIILIGDRHYSLPFSTIQQYKNALNHLIDANHKENIKTKIFIENTIDHTYKEDDLDFLEGISVLNQNDNTQLVLSDDRAWSKGLCDSINFIRKLAEFEDLVRTKLQNEGYNVPDVFHFPKNDERINIALKNIANYYDNKLSFDECETLFEIQLDQLIEILKKYEDKNLMFEKFIAESYSDLYLAYEDFGKLKNNYEMLYQSERVGAKTLDELAIKMIIHDGHFESIRRLLSIFLDYVGPFLDVTLACKLWEEIHNNTNIQTIMVCAGSDHVKRLAALLQQFCKEIHNVSINYDEASIPPHEIKAYLDGEFKECRNENAQQCRIL